MSIANLLTSQYPNDQSYLNITVNNLAVDGTESIGGNLTVAGNIAVQNANPSISILNNATNANGSTLILQGSAALAATPGKIQQVANGTLNIQNLSSADINLNPLTGFVDLNGPNYPAGPYLLALNSSNQIVSGGPPSGLTINEANFYALMPGDNSATVAVGAAVQFPNLGPNTASSITALSSSTFQLAHIGTYRILCQVSFNEAGQLIVNLNGADLVQTCAGRATGTNQCVIMATITTSVINSVLSINNPTGNSTALTITPNAGGASVVSANLIITQIA
jgi:hypothetical protein